MPPRDTIGECQRARVNSVPMHGSLGTVLPGNDREDMGPFLNVLWGERWGRGGGGSQAGESECVHFFFFFTSISIILIPIKCLSNERKHAKKDYSFLLIPINKLQRGEIPCRGERLKGLAYLL